MARLDQLSDGPAQPFHRPCLTGPLFDHARYVVPADFRPELPHDRQPVMIAIDAVGGGVGLEGLRPVERGEESRLVRSRTVEQEPVVLEGRFSDAPLNCIVTIAHGRVPSSCCPDVRPLPGRKQAQSPAARAGTRGRMAR